MMTATAHTTRGLTLVEMMLALSITAMIGAAVAAMLGAVSTGLETRRDSRTHLLQANAAQIRLSAYVAPSLCVLHADAENLVLWLNDSRPGGTVHATEIRWLLFDEDDGVLSVHRVDFPSTWTEAQKKSMDMEMGPTTDWMGVFNYYNGSGWTTGFPIVDGLSSVSITTDHVDDLESRHVTYRFDAANSQVRTLVSATLQTHQKPQ